MSQQQIRRQRQQQAHLVRYQVEGWSKQSPKKRFLEQRLECSQLGPTSEHIEGLDCRFCSSRQRRKQDTGINILRIIAPEFELVDLPPKFTLEGTVGAFRLVWIHLLRPGGCRTNLSKDVNIFSA